MASSVPDSVRALRDAFFPDTKAAQGQRLSRVDAMKTLRYYDTRSGEFTFGFRVGDGKVLLCNGATVAVTGHGNFDIILVHLTRVCQPSTTPPVPCDVLYVVPMLVGC